MNPETPLRAADIPRMLAYFGEGGRPRDEWAVGTEYEKIPVRQGDFAPLPYDGDVGIRAILEDMASRFGWEPIEEQGRVIALRRDGASITLEPGGQLELSGAPTMSLRATWDELVDHHNELCVVSESLGVRWMWAGANPLHPLDAVPWMPKGRYAVMRRYLATRGSLAHVMMKQTCTVQANLDYADAMDGARKLRIATAVSPYVTAMFANSPFHAGRPTGYKSYRYHVWRHVDPDRCGFPPGVFRDDYTLEDYGRWVLDVPMFFVIRDGGYVDLAGRSFHDLLEGRLEGVSPTWADWETHVSTFFPEVRVKRHIEIRGADVVPPRMVCALPALWKGILYDDTACDEAWRLVSALGLDDHPALTEAVARDGLATRLSTGTVLDVARDLLGIAREGLRRQQERCANRFDLCMLSVLEEDLDEGLCPADRLIRAYEDSGGGRAGIEAVVAGCLLEERLAHFDDFELA